MSPALVPPPPPPPIPWSFIKQNLPLLGAIGALAAALFAGGAAYGSLRSEVNSIKESVERIETRMVTKDDLQREVSGLKREIQQTSKALSAQITTLAIDVGGRLPSFPIAKYEALNRTWDRPTPAFLVVPVPGRTKAAPNNAVDIYPENLERRVQAIFDAKVAVCDRVHNVLEIAYIDNTAWTATYGNLKIADSVKKDDTVLTGQVIGSVIEQVPLHFTLKVEVYPLSPPLYLPSQQKK